MGDLVEQEGSSCGSGEAGGDELGAVGQDGVTVGTGEEAAPTNVIQEDTTHVELQQFRATLWQREKPLLDSMKHTQCRQKQPNNMLLINTWIFYDTQFTQVQM